LLCLLEEKFYADAASAVAAIVDSNYGADVFSLRGHVASVGKGDFQFHSNEVVQHQCDEVKSIAIEVNYQRDIFEVSQPRIERTQMRGER